VSAAAHTKCGVNAAKMQRKIGGAREMRRKCGAHGGYYTNAAEMRRKCGENAAEMRRKCGGNAAKMPQKCGKNAAQPRLFGKSVEKAL